MTPRNLLYLSVGRPKTDSDDPDDLYMKFLKLNNHHLLALCISHIVHAIRYSFAFTDIKF